VLCSGGQLTVQPVRHAAGRPEIGDGARDEFRMSLSAELGQRLPGPEVEHHAHARLDNPAHAVVPSDRLAYRALLNATRFMQEGGCDAVKPQGGKSQAHILKALVDAGIPTASHIGLTPHTIAMFGGFRIQGRTAEAALKILEDALAIQDAGCFMLEFEAVPAKIAAVISRQLDIPTIGIGAGAGCDGQILLSYDLLGVFTDFKVKFTKRYANLTEVAVAGLSQYVAEVKAGQFPDDDHSYGVDEKEYERFLNLVEKRKQI